jgi:hypothetical protein
MILRGAFILLLAIMLFRPAVAVAAAGGPAPQLSTEGEENGPIPAKEIGDYLANCKFNIPARFTPDAREYYCTCNAAAVQGNFLMKDFRALQNRNNQRVGNALFEKYMSVAVAPCMDFPAQQIEYLGCLLDHSLDPRIRYVPGFCSCLGKKVRNHVQEYGLSDMMLRYGTYRDTFRDPVNSLWDSRSYVRARLRARGSCLDNQNQ